MEPKKETEVIDLGKMMKKLWANKKTFCKVLPIVFIIACIYIFSKPRFYTSEVKLAPESESGFDQSSLGGLAASFGFDIGGMSTSDAIFPELYPELLGTNDFICRLFPITVETSDGKLKTDYFNYLNKHQKAPWWNGLLNPLWNLLKSDDEQAVANNGNGNNTADPHHLNKRQDLIAGAIKGNIACNIDRKTSLITISITDQDPLVCAIVADSVRLMIQQFIIEYRTKKARIDVDYYTKLTNEAKAEYDAARIAFASFADSHRNTILESSRSRQNDLESEMQLKYNNYTGYNTQLQVAMAKLQQRTPSFTLLQGASVPTRPAGPKRVRFVFVMLFLAFLCTSGYILVCKSQLDS